MNIQEAIELAVKENIAITFFKYTKGRDALLNEMKDHKGCGIGTSNSLCETFTIYPPSECTAPHGQEDDLPTPNYLL